METLRLLNVALRGTPYPARLSLLTDIGGAAVVDKEALVIEQTMAYLRECHGYQMTLTGRVVALNLAALAAYGVILSSSPVGNLKALPDLLLVAFGFLAFGIWSDLLSTRRH